ncbi:ABC-type nickel/cobalt efflux system permease component RcnA [Cricetibacter osteomyelitidis]|uniref:Nickel/cobalt efflux system n=1 Tax=Cricetibacter osteomyelitidis TaxID=1521931 RepID=A0A4R2T3C9_9PAST|nr:zinc transporter permease subunit ZevB [Cricetibacter osteomyelitidis]TCP95344.1 ABC-type nickel/cobalt efflux system permease component RcnA [Cricetibacter osteomyelitidis]
MRLNRWFSLLLLGLLIAAIFYLFPFLFKQVVVWQREFNQLMSGYLHQIKQNPTSAGTWLIAISFAYGVFHSLGPGHGKFIIASYLSTHQSKIKTSIILTVLSSFMQGVVAVAATSIVVVALNLSSAYFKLSELWLERFAFILLMLLGFIWVLQSAKKFLKTYRTSKQKTSLRIKSIQSMAISPHNMMLSAVRNRQEIHDHSAGCACGHQHIPNQSQLNQATDIKSQLLVILSIGMRPCTGAIFILFLSYMLDLFAWGIVATFAMSLGTGITLSAFALLVQYARKLAVRVGQWYLSPHLTKNSDVIIKLTVGILLIMFAGGLLYGSTLPSVGGATLFGR